MRFAASIVILLSAFFVTSHLQVNEHARLVTRTQQVLEGRLSRDFLTGDYRIEAATGATTQLADADVVAMSYEGSTIPWYASSLGFMLMVLAGCVGLDVDKAVIHWLRARRTTVRPGLTHDELPPSRRET